MEPEDHIEPQPQQEPQLTPAKRRKQIYTLMIVAVLGAVAAGVLLASTVWQWKWNSGPSSPSQTATAAIDPVKACASQSAFDAIKQQLFQRAAQTRGRDQAAYARIADFSLLRVDSPSVLGIDDQQHRIDCGGTAVLELPPQITVASGGNMLSTTISYSVQLGPGGTVNLVAIGNTDAIVAPLATIASVAPPALTAPAPMNEAGPGFGNEMQPLVPGATPSPPPTQAQNEIEATPPPVPPQEPENQQ